MRPGYKGGLSCRYDGTQCRLKQGFEFDDGRIRTLYLRYTVKWVDMDPSVLPLKVYIFDITDTWKKTGTNAEHIRKVDIATINYLAFFYPNKISSSLAEYCF